MRRRTAFGTPGAIHPDGRHQRLDRDPIERHHRVQQRERRGPAGTSHGVVDRGPTPDRHPEQVRPLQPEPGQGFLHPPRVVVGARDRRALHRQPGFTQQVDAVHGAPLHSGGRFVRYIGVEALRPGSSTTGVAGGALEAVDAHGAQRRRQVESSIERRQQSHAGAVCGEEVGEGILVDEVTEFPAAPPRRDVDVAGRRGR